LGLVACKGGSGAAQQPPPPPPVTVSVAPSSANVVLGATQSFTATVSNAANTAVTWSVNSVSGGNSSVGTISASGLYTAPQLLPSPAAVTVTAISQADPTRSASATVSVTSDVVVSVSPAAPPVELGAMLQFTASVTSAGNPDRRVNWSVDGIPGGSSTLGTVDANGLYTAPSILPTPPSVTLTATSVADPSKSGNASVSTTSNFTITVAGPTLVDNGASAQFTATVTPVPGSNPALGVLWSVSGPGCAGTACGVVDNAGFYTAPLLAPSPPVVNVVATSVADPAKSATASVTINTIITVSIAPSPITVFLESSEQFTATVTGTADQRVTWYVNDIVGGDQNTVGAITNPGTGSATYFAPTNMPPGRRVTIRATSQADPSKSASVVANLESTIGFTGVPGAAARAVNRVLSLTAFLSGTSNPAYNLTVDGIPGGNATLGQTCFVGSNPCFPISAAASGDTIEYRAPASVPPTGSVTLTLTSQADPARSASTVITIVANVSVSVTPAAATLPLGAMQQFTASVIGSADQSVSWSVAGTSCSGGPCGSISPAGLYTSPASAPTNAADTIIATSTDGNQTGAATVTLATSAFIQKLLPASVAAGAAAGFVLKVQGVNFVPGSGAGASEILFNGNARTTSCASNTECTVGVVPAEVAAAGSQTIQVRNPDATFSNLVNLVVAASQTTEETIPLTAPAPSATGKDIVVVEPTGAGTGTAYDLVVVGLFSQSTCSAGSGPIGVQRPASGVVNVDLCLAGSSVDASHTFTLSGGDIPISGVQSLGLGFVKLTLTVSSTARRGARTLFVESPNKDKTAATGAIEVK
jgi:hypothetical protein